MKDTKVFIIEFEFYEYVEQTLTFPVNAMSSEAIWLELRMLYEVAREKAAPDNSFIRFNDFALQIKSAMSFEANFEKALTIYPLEEWLRLHNVRL